ncbi:MAG: hypothetical protein HQL03_02280 [Nitrospirae bacterium]|nr:hypothetical protein [Nitrospirota bacterium]
MIEQQFFNDITCKTALLNGYPRPSNDVLQYLYVELKNEGTADLMKAYKELSYTGNRITLAGIMSLINSYKRERLQSEAQRQKRIEEKEADSFFSGKNSGDDIGYTTISTIKDILSKKITLKEGLTYLSDKSPDTGFEDELKKI